MDPILKMKSTEKVVIKCIVLDQQQEKPLGNVAVLFRILSVTSKRRDMKEMSIMTMTS